MKRIQKILAVVLVAALLIGLAPMVGGSHTATAYAAPTFTPPHSVIRIGINAFRSWAVQPSATLAHPNGLQVGSFNSDREFVPSSNAIYTRLYVTASGSTVTIRTGEGETVHSGGTVAIGSINPNITTTYILPNAPVAGQTRRDFLFFGGFRFTASGGNLTVVNYVDLEDYIKGVVPYEMPASWPLDALKAQALTARTFAVRNFGRNSSHGFDLSNSTWCQVYRGMHDATDHTNRSVTETAGQFILHDGRPIDAVYHSTSGGATENSENVWVSAVPYLRGVWSPYSVIESVRWSRTLSPAEFLSHMRSRDSNFNLPDIADVIPTYTEMGNVFSVRFVASNGATRSYYRSAARGMVNTGLHPTFNSQRFTITRNDPAQIDLSLWETRDSDLDADRYTLEELAPYYSQTEIMELAAAGLIDLDLISDAALEALSTGGLTFTITNYGFGHNVGMSQWGARALAAAGYTYYQIIHFYYQGVTITNHEGTRPPIEPPPPPPPPGFTDVQPGRWYYAAIQYVREHGLMNGISATLFAPNQNTTRGMFVTILGRMAGVNELDYAPTGTINGSLVNIRSGPSTGHGVVGQASFGATVTITGRSAGWLRIHYDGRTGYVLATLVTPTRGAFSDVAAGAFYAPFVEWAYANDITSGTGGGRFSPAQTLTRQEMAALLYGYTRALGISLPQSTVTPFTDIDSVANWARPAVEALQRAGIIQGTGGGQFNPRGVSNRASVASMIANYHAQISS